MDANTDTVGSYADLLTQDRDDDFDDVFEGNDHDNVKNTLTLPVSNRRTQRSVSKTDSVGSKALSGSILRRNVRFQLDRSPSNPSTTGGIDLVPEEVVTLDPKDDPDEKKKPKICYELKTKIALGLLAVFMMTGIALIFHLSYLKLDQITMGKWLVFVENTRDIKVLNQERQEVLLGKLGVNLPGEALPYFCSPKKDIRKIQDGLVVDAACLSWHNRAVLHISIHATDDIHCYDISWQSLAADFLLEDCYALDGAHWYGGGLKYGQQWPLENMNVSKTPFIAGTIHDTDWFGPVIEPYWLTSKGVSIIVDEGSPLHVSINAPGDSDGDDSGATSDRKLCLYGDYNNAPFLNPQGKLPVLNYTVCVASNVTRVHQFTLQQFAKPPLAHPKDAMFQHPVWSTWAVFKNNVTQANISGFCSSIVDQQYGHSALVLDDGWENSYGDFIFDKVKFPDPASMVKSIQNKGFDMHAAVHPYVNFDSEAFVEGIDRELLVQDASGAVAGLTRWFDGPPESRWYRGVAAVCDATPQALDWLTARLHNLSQQYNIQSIRLDGGEVDMLPYYPHFQANISNPNQYLRKLVEFSMAFGNASQVRVGYKTQHVPVFTRLYGFTSTWRGPNGLSSVIPAVLSLGILGYPFVLTDVIGGNAYDDMPSHELYIRWFQLSTFLPTMQLSIPPHAYDSRTLNITKALLDLHASTVYPEVLRLLSEAATSLHPIVRPLWWSWPNDNKTFAIGDQFMVGDKLLVAPILTEGATSRDIYLPEGSWQDQLRGDVKQGPLLLKHYGVALSEIAYFVLAAVDS